MILTIIPTTKIIGFTSLSIHDYLDATGGGNRIRTYGPDYSGQLLSRQSLSSTQAYLQVTISKTASKLNCIKNSLPVFLQFSSLSCCPYFLLPQDNPICLAFLRIFSLLCRVASGARSHNLKNHNLPLCQLSYSHHIMGHGVGFEPTLEFIPMIHSHLPVTNSGNRAILKNDRSTVSLSCSHKFFIIITAYDCTSNVVGISTITTERP